MLSGFRPSPQGQSVHQAFVNVPIASQRRYPSWALVKIHVCSSEEIKYQRADREIYVGDLHCARCS